jgi:hypothetical protein
MASIKRVWVKATTDKVLNDTMYIWDSGSLRYERMNEKETVWNVLEREETPTGFVETLVEVPLYNTPIGSTWKETISCEPLGKNGFRIPGWSVTWAPAKR